MEKASLPRVFTVKRDGEEYEINDPNPALSTEEVRKFLSATYPELTNATVDQPEIKDDKVHFSFTPKIGIRG